MSAWEVYTETRPVARKNYACNAVEYIEPQDNDYFGFTKEEIHIIEYARKFGIGKHQKYIKVKGRWDGEWVTFRASIDVDEICRKYEIYPDE